MLIDTCCARVVLRAAEHARLERARGLRLTAVQGTAWITIDGVVGDIVISDGSSFVVPSDARVLAMPMHGAATLALDGRAGPRARASVVGNHA